MKAYQIKITIKNSHPPIWRRAIIPSGITFSQLAILLNEIMGWCGYHMFRYQFYHRKLEIWEDNGEFFEPSCDYDLLDASETYIDEYMESEEWFTYIYDLGDDWSHRVTIEKVIDDYSDNYAKVIKYKGDCPPEDMGGLEGYYAYLNGTYEEFSGDPVDDNMSILEEYDVDYANGNLKHMWYVEYKSGDSRLARDMYEDMFAGRYGLTGSKKPINKNEPIKRRFDMLDNNEIFKLYDERIESWKKQHNITDEQFIDILTGKKPRVLLRQEILTLSKEDLLDTAKEYFLEVKKSWTKDKIADSICGMVLNPEVMQNRLLQLDDEEMAVFNKALACDEYKIEAGEWQNFERLYDWMYVLVTIDDLVVIPSDVREVYESITSEDFELRRKTVSWVGQCLTFLDFYYGCAAVDIVLKLVHTKKGCRISKEELLDCVGLYEERFAIIDDYIMAIGLADNNKYKQLIRNQGENKSYYIPTRDEIEHFYKTHFQLPDSYHKDMAQFIKKFCDIPGEEQDITDLMQRIIYDNGSMQDVMDMLDENGIYFDAQKDLEKFVPLFNDLWNNTRMLENKGHTPNEIMREIPRVQKSTNRFPVIVPGSSHAAEILQEGKKEIEEMGFEIDFDSNAKEINVLTLDTKGNITKSGTKKVYPNDPCPCGSGKKYKKCCGR